MHNDVTWCYASKNGWKWQLLNVLKHSFRLKQVKQIMSEYLVYIETYY